VFDVLIAKLKVMVPELLEAHSDVPFELLTRRIEEARAAACWRIGRLS
jgi:hypothetical protein